MGPTPTRTLGMRLSCNFVHVYMRASLTGIFARKSARVGQFGGQVGEDRRACPASGLPREDPCAEVGEDVRIGVRVGRMEFQLYNTSIHT